MIRQGGIYGAPGGIHGAPGGIFGAPGGIYRAPGGIYGAPLGHVPLGNMMVHDSVACASHPYDGCPLLAHSPTQDGCTFLEHVPPVPIRAARLRG